MNKFIILAILCFVCNISFGSDFYKLKFHARDFNLKGKVKCFIEPVPILEDTIYHYFDKNGYKIKEVKAHGNRKMSQLFKRNSKGQIIDWIVSYTHESHPDFLKVIKVSPVYDKNSNLIEMRLAQILEKREDEINEDEEYLGRVVYQYDDLGNMIEKQEYEESRLISRETYKYDKNNNIIETEGFTTEPTCISQIKVILEYNAKKEVLSIINYGFGGDKITNRQDFTYAYNKNGTVQEENCKSTDYNDTENRVVLKTTKYDYDSNKNLIRVKVHSDGVLQEQIEYTVEYYK